MVSLRQAMTGMQHFRNCYNFESQNMMRSSYPQMFLSEIYKKSLSKPKSKEEMKLIAAKKHSESEKKRRMRINSQYVTLRTILPNLVKMDKASVLGETVRQVMELKRKVSELEATSSGSGGKIVFPSGADKLNLERCDNEKDLVKAILSCEDRPDLMSCIARSLESVKAKAVKAEMVTVGGRTRIVLWVQGLHGGNEGMGILKRNLKVAMHRPSKIG